MNGTDFSSLNRLLRPRSIAVIGGKFADRVIRQCDLLEFDGDIWPVNPHRDIMQSRTCFSSVPDLPGVPDAAFIAVSNHDTINVVRELSEMQAGGVVCYASGFAEIGGKGVDYQQELTAALGDMALIGPNCYGFLNYQDGVALWPDEQGGQRCSRGVAIISQSGNITVSLTMQRRGVPIAFLISTGNMAGVKPHDYIHAMLGNANITAIGLYLENLVDAYELSVAAIAALKKGIPIVVLESGHSEIGARVTRTHSYSLSTNSRVSCAFYQRYGIIQVQSIPQLLETLKLVSIIPASDNPTIASISCSGGEAALMADLVNDTQLDFAEFSETQRCKLNTILGDRVVVANPLDYHTYIWGNQAAQTDCFQTVYEGTQNLTINVIDFPTAGICDAQEWDSALRAITDAKDKTGTKVVAVSTLHENFPLEYQTDCLKHGIPPMFGMVECINAIAASVQFAATAKIVDRLEPLTQVHWHPAEERSLTEYQGKQKLRQAGFPVVSGEVVYTADEAIALAARLTYPVVVKVSLPKLMHKTDVGGVMLDIRTENDLKKAYTSIARLSEEVLIEHHLREPVAELLIGARMDRTFGPIMVVGAGGRLANLIEDSIILHFPIAETEVRAGLGRLKINQLLRGYRGPAGDMEAVVELILKLAKFVADANNRISEIEINPLYVYSRNNGVTIADVVYRYYP